MKNLSGLFFVMFLLVGALGFVAAEEHENIVPELISAVPVSDGNVIGSNGDVPEARKIGFFENFGYNLGLAFTFNKELKIEKILEMAEKRLAEAELLASENPEAYERAQERYDKLLAKAEEVLADIESGDDVNESVEDMEKIVRIQNKFERHRAHTDEIYTRVFERFVLNNASDEKIERFEMFYERAINRSYRMETRIIEKKGKFVEKYKNLSEASDDDVNRTLMDIEEREGLNESREERRLKAEIRIDRVIDIKGRYIEKMRLRLESSDLNNEERSRIELRIEETSGRIEKFELRVRERFESEDGRFELRIRERFEDGEFRTEIRVRDRNDSARDALRAEEDVAENALRAEEDATKDALRAEEDAAKDALRAEEDATKDAEN